MSRCFTCELQNDQHRSRINRIWHLYWCGRRSVPAIDAAACNAAAALTQRLIRVRPAPVRAQEPPGHRSPSPRHHAKDSQPFPPRPLRSPTRRTNAGGSPRSPPPVSHIVAGAAAPLSARRSARRGGDARTATREERAALPAAERPRECGLRAEAAPHTPRAQASTTARSRRRAPAPPRPGSGSHGVGGGRGGCWAARRRLRPLKRRSGAACGLVAGAAAGWCWGRPLGPAPGGRRCSAGQRSAGQRSARPFRGAPGRGRAGSRASGGAQGEAAAGPAGAIPGAREHVLPLLPRCGAQPCRAESERAAAVPVTPRAWMRAVHRRFQPCVVRPGPQVRRAAAPLRHVRCRRGSRPPASLRVRSRGRSLPAGARARPRGSGPGHRAEAGGRSAAPRCRQGGVSAGREPRPWA